MEGESNKAQTVLIADCNVGLMSDRSRAFCFDTLAKQTPDTPLIAVNRATTVICCTSVTRKAMGLLQAFGYGSSSAARDGVPFQDTRVHDAVLPTSAEGCWP